MTSKKGARMVKAQALCSPSPTCLAGVVWRLISAHIHGQSGLQKKSLNQVALPFGAMCKAWNVSSQRWGSRHTSCSVHFAEHTECCKVSLLGIRPQVDIASGKACLKCAMSGGFSETQAFANAARSLHGSRNICIPSQVTRFNGGSTCCST